MARFENQEKWTSALFSASVFIDRAIDDLRDVANDMRDIIMNGGDGLCEDDMTVLKRYFGLVGGVMAVSISEIAGDLCDDLLGKGKEKG